MIDAGARTLIHFLWQGTLIWLVVAIQLRFLRQARTRYAVACAAMLLMLVLPLGTLIVLQDDAISTTPAGEFVASSASFFRAVTSSAAAQTPWMPIVVWMWAGGVALVSIRNAGGLALAYIW